MSDDTHVDVDFIPSDSYMEANIHDELAGIKDVDSLSWRPADVVPATKDEDTSLVTWKLRVDTVKLGIEVVALFSRTGPGASWLSREGWEFPKITTATPGLLRTRRSVGAEAESEAWARLKESSHSKDLALLRDWRCGLNMAALWYFGLDPRVVMMMSAFTRAEIVRGECWEKDILDEADEHIVRTFGIEDQNWLLDSYNLLESVAPLDVLTRHSGT